MGGQLSARSVRGLVLGKLTGIAAGALLVVLGCAEPTPIFSCPSPDGELTAVATREWKKGPGIPPGARGIGRLYIQRITSPHDLGEPILETEAPIPVRFSWLGPRSLRIEYPPEVRILHQASSHLEAALTFVPGYSPRVWSHPGEASECISTSPAA